MNAIATIPTNNPAWGFWGTMSHRAGGVPIILPRFKIRFHGSEDAGFPGICRDVAGCEAPMRFGRKWAGVDADRSESGQEGIQFGASLVVDGRRATMALKALSDGRTCRSRAIPISARPMAARRPSSPVVTRHGVLAPSTATTRHGPNRRRIVAPVGLLVEQRRAVRIGARGIDGISLRGHEVGCVGRLLVGRGILAEHDHGRPAGDEPPEPLQLSQWRVLGVRETDAAAVGKAVHE